MGEGRSRPVRRVVFLWENIGPMHGDRLIATARALAPDVAVIGIELHGRSQIYPWHPGERGGYQAHTLAPDGRVTWPVLAWRLMRLAARLGRGDYYLCHYQRPEVAVAALLLRLAGCRPFAMANSAFGDRRRGLGREALKWLALRPYRGALCGSRRSLDYLAFLGLPRARLRLGYNTLSVRRIADQAPSAPAPGGVPFAERDFLVVARLVPKKNIALAIHAYALWLARHGGARDLHLCGSGPLEAELRALVARLGLGARVHFHGFLQTDGVSALLARALCLILPSMVEQYGNVVIEAQAMGVPVLVSHAAGAADLIEGGVNGYVIDPHDPRGCAALMAELASDEARWRRFATAAHAGRERGDVQRFVAGVAVLSGVTIDATGA